MALRIGDEFSEIIGNDVFEARTENWVKVYLGVTYPGRHDISAMGRSQLADFIISQQGLADVVRAQQLLPRLPEEKFSWLTNRGAQNFWISNYLRYLKGPDRQPATLLIEKSNFLVGRDRFIAVVDVYQASLFDKENYVRDAEMAWIRQMQFDRGFDWFKGDAGVVGYELLWDWLSKKRFAQTVNRARIDSHEELLSFFYEFPLDVAEAKLMVLDIKKAWSQRKYRASLKGRRQCNLILREKTIAQLDKLSEKYKLSRSELLEFLINEEAEQEVYVTQRIQKRQVFITESPV